MLAFTPLPSGLRLLCTKDGGDKDLKPSYPHHTDTAEMTRMYDPLGRHICTVPLSRSRAQQVTSPPSNRSGLYRPILHEATMSV